MWAEEHRVVLGGEGTALVVTGGTAPTVSRAEPTGNGRFAMRNATARGRYRAYWRRPRLGAVPSTGRLVGIG